MDWNRILDGYCERLGTDPNLWGEPVNAVTNAAFLVAAGWALREALRAERFDWSAGLLCANVAAIGIGSFLFHTFATPWAELADVIPIRSMILLYFGLVLRRACGLNRYGAERRQPPDRSWWCARRAWRPAPGLSLRASS